MSRTDNKSVMTSSEFSFTPVYNHPLRKNNNQSFTSKNSNVQVDMGNKMNFSSLAKEAENFSNISDNIKKVDETPMESKKPRVTAAMRKNMLEAQYEQKTENEYASYHVLVLEVLSDCKLSSFQPVFLNLVEEDTRIIPTMEQKQSTASLSDITFIDKCLKSNYDFIAINDVTSKECINEVKELTHRKPHVRVIAKIQSPAAIKNIVEIIEASDGITISRNYLANFIPNEYNYYIQTNIINQCKRRGKPVFIIGHIFESMINSAVPNCSEINDVIGLINEGIDGLIVGNETMFA